MAKNLCQFVYTSTKKHTAPFMGVRKLTVQSSARHGRESDAIQTGRETDLREVTWVMS